MYWQALFFTPDVSISKSNTFKTCCIRIDEKCCCVIIISIFDTWYIHSPTVTMASRRTSLSQMWELLGILHINKKLSCNRVLSDFLTYSKGLADVWPQEKEKDRLCPISRDIHREKYSKPCPLLQGVLVNVVSELQLTETTLTAWVESSVPSFNIL